MAKENFVSHLDEVIAAFKSQMEAAMEECGMDAEYYAKRGCKAVDTGRLRNSITHATSINSGVDAYADDHGKGYSGGSAMGTVEEYTVAVGTNVEYAEYIENGTYKMGARPFIKPAIADHKAHYHDVIKRHLQG